MPYTKKDSHYARLRREHRSKTSCSTHKKDKSSSKHKEIIFLYGLHTVMAALANPLRKIHHLFATENALKRLGPKEQLATIPTTIVTHQQINKKVEADAVHQGVLLQVEALPQKTMQDLKQGCLILLLDQITDPHNVGAILRSAVAFNVDAVIVTTRYAPKESAVLAKAASGALEMVDIISVRNLAQSLAELHKLGFHTIGLDSEGSDCLQDVFQTSKIALVLGAEGKGLRAKTAQSVQNLARLDIPGKIKSLNVSNAAAISLYSANQYLNAFKELA